MPFVTRDPSGALSGVLRDDPGGAEFLEPHHPELQAFMATIAPSAEAFDRLDADFVRVLEDVIEALMARNVIAVTDLPETAQAKLFARKRFRERRPQHALSLFRESGLGAVI
ncbi:MAG: hypothetical protein ACK520_01780 [Inhella sp.]